MPYVIVDGYIVWEADGFPSTITAGDGSTDSFSPLAVTAWSPSSESANRIETLIDGTIAVTVLGDQPRSGNLSMIFSNDTDADNARTLLGRPTTFVLAVPDRPIVNMTFVRQGSITSAIHDQARDVWEFSVGFQEILL